MSFNDLDSIYGFLNPLDSSKSDGVSKKKYVVDIIMKLLLDNGHFVKYEDIKDKLNTFLKSKSKEEIADYSSFFHAVGTTGCIDALNDKDTYWNAHNRLGIGKEQRINVSLFTIRGPYVSPARRNTDSIEFFLNYTPTIFASQMVPYLDVEFELVRPQNSTSISSPTLLRFLLGSVNTSRLTDADKSLENILQVKENNNVSTISYSGMEMFLSPQTLTNMNTLSSSDTRLVNVKPFLPFASIESFDISLVSAGAGAFVTKKGTLKLKIHDKSRIAEISEFIRGPVGYRKALIWTTYGWVAPRGRTGDDQYAKFINETMLKRDCWIVANANFSLSESGQAGVTLELVTKGISTLQETKISASKDLNKQYTDFSSIVSSIARIRAKIPGQTKEYNTEIRTEQLLEVASTTGDIGKLKNVSASIEKLATSLQSRNTLEPKDLQELKEGLTKLANKVNDKSYKERLEDATNDDVKNAIDKICDKDDPFKNGWSDIVKVEADKFGKRINELSKKEKERTQQGFEIIKYKQKKIFVNQPVVTFGHLFYNLIVPAITAKRTCDELQVIFYSLNDSCGPISGHSVAEFPIDMRKLAYENAELIKTIGQDALTIEQFLKFIIKSQFEDNRAIGYGMNSFYENFNPDAKAEVNDKSNKTLEDDIMQWGIDYGSLKRPVIEMLIESGKPIVDGNVDKKTDILYSLKTSQAQNKLAANQDKSVDSQYIIKRIHVYDKNNTPYELLSKIINQGNYFSIGKINYGKLSGVIAAGAAAARENAFSTKKNLTEQYDDFIKLLRDIQGYAEQYSASFIDRPDGDEIIIPKNRKALKASLSRLAPTIQIGTNGTTVLNASLASKTDQLMGAANIINQNNTQPDGSVVPSTGLEGPNGLPMRVVPASLTMTTLGCPIAALYQQYMIDFDTGTSLDNLYTSTQIQHSITPGKFTTSWSFAYSDGYGKFSAAPSLVAAANGEVKKLIEEANEELAKAKNKKK